MEHVKLRHQAPPLQHPTQPLRNCHSQDETDTQRGEVQSCVRNNIFKNNTEISHMVCSLIIVPSCKPVQARTHTDTHTKLQGCFVPFNTQQMEKDPHNFGSGLDCTDEGTAAGKEQRLWWWRFLVGFWSPGQRVQCPLQRAQVTHCCQDSHQSEL